MAQYIVDATSPSYQVDAAHAPDKQSLWAHPMESDGWTHAHNAIRYELAAMSGVLAKLGSRPLSAWEVESMQAWWNTSTTSCSSCSVRQTCMRAGGSPGAMVRMMAVRTRGSRGSGRGLEHGGEQAGGVLRRALGLLGLLRHGQTTDAHERWFSRGLSRTSELPGAQGRAPLYLKVPIDYKGLPHISKGCPYM